MNEFLCGLAMFAIIAILLAAMEVYFSSAKAAPKSKIAGDLWYAYSRLRTFAFKKDKKVDLTRIALTLGILLISCIILSLAVSFLAPYILLLAFLALIFFPSKTSENETAPQSPWLAPPIEIIRGAMFLALRKLAAYSASHMHPPIEECDLQIQSCVLKGAPAFQICYAKDDSPEDTQENHIMLSRINTYIRQLIQSDQIAGIAYPIQEELFTCVSVRNRGIYWEFFIIYTPEGFLTFFPHNTTPPTVALEEPSPTIRSGKKIGLPICWDWELLKEGIKSPILWNYQRNPSLLLIGNTGSGKTNAAKVILFQMSKIREAQITVCDYKAEDGAFLNGAARYYSFKDCVNGLNNYYADFETRQSGTDTSRTFKILVFDEWASFINMLDKKEAETTKMKLSTLLMLGRSFNFHVIIIQQRADSSFFAIGARDQFSVICALGNISKESAFMFGFDRERMEPIPNPGNGYMLTNGVEQKGISFPYMKDNTIINQTIFEAVTR